MALNYLQRVAMSAVRTAAPVKPVAFGPPPMPGRWVGMGSRPAFPAAKAESSSPAVREGARESPRHAAPVEAPAPVRPMEEQPKPVSPRDASGPKPAAVLDRLLGPAPQTVVRVPRTLRPIKPPAPIQPGTIKPETESDRRATTTQPAEIEQVAVSSATTQPKTSSQPGGTEEIMVPHPVEAQAVIELNKGRPQQVEANGPLLPRVTRQESATAPTPVQPVPIPLEQSQASEMPRPRPDHIQPANHAEPPRLVFPRKRESRISIGRVEVQVNNQPAAGPPPAPAVAPASAGDSLSGRYLGRFALRP
jgi:hypothetical protein